MTEAEQFLLSIGFVQEHNGSAIWWCDPFFPKDSVYRQVFLVTGDAVFSAADKTIPELVRAIQANTANWSRNQTEKHVRQEAARELETALKKVVKQLQA